MSDQTPDDRIPLTERLIGAFLYAPVFLSRALPYRWRVPFAGWFTSRILAPAAGYTKRIRENLALAMPGLDKAEVERIVRGVTDNAGRNMVEMYSPEFTECSHNKVINNGPGISGFGIRIDGKSAIASTGPYF